MAKTETTEVARDAFGSKLDTQAAWINAAITTEPKTASEIAEAAGVSVGRAANHLSYLLKRGLVVKGEVGYALPAATAKTKKSKKKVKEAGSAHAA